MLLVLGIVAVCLGALLICLNAYEGYMAEKRAERVLSTL